MNTGDNNSELSKCPPGRTVQGLAIVCSKIAMLQLIIKLRSAEFDLGPIVNNMTHQILPPSDVYLTCFALSEYTTSAHYTTYLNDLSTELTLAFSALAIGVRACFFS